MISVKVIRNKKINFPEGYGFLEVNSHAAALRALQQYHGQLGDKSKQMHSVTKTNGVLRSTRPMRNGPATTKKPATGGQQFHKVADILFYNFCDNGLPLSTLGFISAVAYQKRTLILVLLAIIFNNHGPKLIVEVVHVMALFWSLI